MPDYEKLFEDLEESIKNKDYAGQLQGTILFNSEAAARQKLAESVGMNVEQLARLVRNNTAGAPGAAVGAAMGDGGNPLLGPTVEIRDGINGMRRDMRDR